jgi:hypothetical protein
MYYYTILVISLFFAQCSFAKDTPIELKGGDIRQARETALAREFKFIHIKDDAHLEDMKREGYLVPIPDEILVDSRLDKKFRFVAPSTANFLLKLHKEFFNEFKISFQINSAVRTLIYQDELRTRNKNAAPSSGDRMSSHPTGATIDIAKLGLTPHQVTWLRKRLVALKKDGTIEAVEEMMQAVFHIMVFKEDESSVIGE